MQRGKNITIRPRNTPWGTLDIFCLMIQTIITFIFIILWFIFGIWTRILKSWIGVRFSFIISNISYKSLVIPLSKALAYAYTDNISILYIKIISTKFNINITKTNWNKYLLSVVTLVSSGRYLLWPILLIAITEKT